MGEYSIIQQALGEQWFSLPGTLQAHYQAKDNTDIGVLDIEYPAWMQVFLNLLHLIGALLNRKGKNISATVEKRMLHGVQYWHRTITSNDGRKVHFKSRWRYAGGNKLIEYVNPLFGLCMSVEVRDKTLYYHGQYFVIKLGKIVIPIPEWLLLGHTTIVEKQAEDDYFSMDFRLRHPLFGQIYRYAGRFTTVSE